MAEFDRLFGQEDDVNEKIEASYEIDYAAKDEGDKETVVSKMAKIKVLKAATDKNSLNTELTAAFLKNIL